MVSSDPPKPVAKEVVESSPPAVQKQPASEDLFASFEDTPAQNKSISSVSLWWYRYIHVPIAMLGSLGGGGEWGCPYLWGVKG